MRISAVAVLVLALAVPEVLTTEAGALVVVEDEAGDCPGAKTVGADTVAEHPAPTDQIKLGPAFGDEEEAGLAGPPPPPFVPTAEWQAVLPNQPIPPGLHVSIDMQTGEKKAKLMEEQVGIQTESERKAEQAKQFGKGVAALDDGPAAPAGNVTAADSAEVRAMMLESFMTRIKELKKRGITVKSDVEVMGTIVGKLAALPPSPEGDEEAIDLLDGLEGFVHQVDNAVDLYSMGGLEEVAEILGDAARTSKVRALAAVVVGASASNNPAANKNALEVGAIPKLLELWQSYGGGGSGDRVAGEPLTYVLTGGEATELKRVIFGTTAILRHSPAGLEQFVSLGGIDLLVGLVKAETPAKVLLRVLVAASDIMLEQAEQLFEKATGAAYTYEDRTVSPYTSELWIKFAGQTLIATLLKESSWCAAAPVVLGSATGAEVQEPLLQTFLGMASHCAAQFSDTAVLGKLDAIELAWGDLLAEEIEDDLNDGYSQGLVELIRTVQMVVRA